MNLCSDKGIFHVRGFIHDDCDSGICVLTFVVNATMLLVEFSFELPAAVASYFDHKLTKAT
jgi:hypothetical protein